MNRIILLLLPVILLVSACAPQAKLVRPDWQNPSHKLVNDQVVPLLRVAGRNPAACKIFFIDSEKINALSAGECRFGLTMGLVNTGDAQFIRGIAAHEVAHEVLGHADKRRAAITTEQLIRTGVSLIPGVGGLIATSAVLVAGMIAVPAYSRSQEAEADAKAVEILKEVNDPDPAGTMAYSFRTLLSRYGAKGGGLLDDHPGTEARLEAMLKLQRQEIVGETPASGTVPGQATSQPLPYIGRSDVIYQLGGQYLNTGQPCPAGQVEVASGLPNTKACIPPAAYTAYQQQQSSPVAPSPPAQEIVGETPTSGTVPVWEIGNEWKFRWTSSGGSGTFVGSIVGEELVNGVACYVMRVGNQDMLFSKAELALVMARSGGAVNMRPSPAYQQFSWPLEAGKEWEVKYRWETPAARQTEDRVRRHKIDAEETITVPAGTVQAFHVTVKDLTGKVVSEYWYSPAVKCFVKDRLYRPSGVIERELVEYTLNPTTASSPR